MQRNLPSPKFPMEVSPFPVKAGPGTASPPLSRRLFSMLYEGVLLFGVVFIAGYLFDTLTQSRSGLANRHARQVWLFIALGIYFTWFWTHSGQTLAMKTWHIRLVDRSGSPLRPLRAAARYFLCWVFLLPTLALLKGFGASPLLSVIGLGLAFCVPPCWMLWDRDSQFVQDRLAGTRLIDTRETPRRNTL
jgi:uncharacterized RDD family membrane protein YckC